MNRFARAGKAASSILTSLKGWPMAEIGKAFGRLMALAWFLTLSYWMAFALRFDFSIDAEQGRLLWRTLPWVIATKLLVCHLLRDVHGWMRYVSFYDLMALVRAAAAASLAVLLLDATIIPSPIPFSVLVLDFGLTVFLVGGYKAAGRFSQEHFWPLLNRHVLKRELYRPALLVGANRMGVVLANQIHFHPTLPYRIAGFLDDDPSLRGTHLGGFQILGGLADAAAVALANGVGVVLVLSNSLSGTQMRALAESCDAAGVQIRVIANVYDLVNGTAGASRQLQLRNVDINDLLQRDRIELNSDSIGGLIRDRVVLVTGAAGSIGSELCRQVLRFEPKSLVIVDRSENGLFDVERELAAAQSGAHVQAVLADVTDESRMRGIFRLVEPEIVFHAAAHKHVGMMERHPREAIKNNVLGTKLLVDLAGEHRVQTFVFISSDKAVNASSVMGLSKRLGERYVQAMARCSTTRFVAVRFGNVLGSAGSVVPIFKEQIARGGPVTVTHPEMRRFFMTIPEASQLVLQAAAMGAGGETFVLEMGEPVRIVDLARDLIRLSGSSPDEIPIVFTSPRDGEKLNEELTLPDEQVLLTAHPKLRIACHPPVAEAQVTTLFGELQLLLRQADGELDTGTIRDRLFQLAEAAPLGLAAAPLPPAAALPAGRPASTTVSTPSPLRVPFFVPAIGELEVAEVTRCLRSGWLTTGPMTKEFEESFARAVGARYAVALNSCTAALHLAMEALGLREGQAVLVPTMTFAATAEVVRYMGAVPVLVDCDPLTANLDLDDAAGKLELARRGQLTPLLTTPLEVVGIAPVHVGGLMMNMDRLQAFARAHGLWVVEDAAHAFPAAWRRPDGSWQRCGEATAEVTCYSFYANKTITTGEGGMAVTDDEAIAQRMRSMSLHGLSHDAWKRYAGGSWDYRIQAPGFKYNLTDIAAAIGVHQLRRAESLRAARASAAATYFEQLSDLEELELPPAPDDRLHAWHLFPVRLKSERLAVNRNQVISDLAQRGVGTSVHWRPLHLHPYYERTFGWLRDQLPVASRVWRQRVSLPLYPDLQLHQQQHVLSALRDILERGRTRRQMSLVHNRTVANA